MLKHNSKAKKRSAELAIAAAAFNAEVCYYSRIILPLFIIVSFLIFDHEGGGLICLAQLNFTYVKVSLCCIAYSIIIENKLQCIHT